MHKLSMFNMFVFVQNFLKEQHSGKELSILDVGSQDINGTFKGLFANEPLWKYEGMDMVEGGNVDIVVSQLYEWKEIGNNKYDVVISGSAFEHIEFPWLTIEEITRVLKPGGLVCITVPSTGFEHRFPIDCYRYYPDGLRALAKWAGLTVISAHKCWDINQIDDEPNFWKDSVLIATKQLKS